MQGVEGIWNQKPSRMEKDAVSLVKIKCQPGGMSLIPQNWAEVLKEMRSIPHSIPGGRSKRSAAAVRIGDLDRSAAMGDDGWASISDRGKNAVKYLASRAQVASKRWM